MSLEMCLEKGLCLGLCWSGWRLLSGSLKTKACPCPGRFGADYFCFWLQDGWLADLFVY